MFNVKYTAVDRRNKRTIEENARVEIEKLFKRIRYKQGRITEAERKDDWKRERVIDIHARYGESSRKAVEIRKRGEKRSGRSEEKWRRNEAWASERESAEGKVN